MLLKHAVQTHNRQVKTPIKTVAQTFVSVPSFLLKANCGLAYFGFVVVPEEELLGLLCEL